MSTPSGHHINCEWHESQYPWECTCGESYLQAAKHAGRLAVALREIIDSDNGGETAAVMLQDIARAALSEAAEKGRAA